MPEDQKKNQPKKGKHEPKEQRRAKPQRQPVNLPPEKKEEVAKEPEKPKVEEPGPEFYKNLKRETEDILKITEEANTKYSKKEIQSNWKKYEVPIESYEELEENENMGADYEKLIQAPLSSGGHFQFKHEKSWDTTTTPSEYDKYFEINMQSLTLGLSSIPFYERNSLDISLFSESEVVSIQNRATKFKQKYYNDNTITTPDLEVNDKILNVLKESLTVDKVERNMVDESLNSGDLDDEGLNLDEQPIETNVLEENIVPVLENLTVAEEDEIDNLIANNAEDFNKTTGGLTISDIDFNLPIENKKQETVKPEVKQAAIPKKPSILEPEEDLEQWLDDFLDS